VVLLDTPLLPAHSPCPEIKLMQKLYDCNIKILIHDRINFSIINFRVSYHFPIRLWRVFMSLTHMVVLIEAFFKNNFDIKISFVEIHVCIFIL
jgi:hypothetical protein